VAVLLSGSRVGQELVPGTRPAKCVDAEYKPAKMFGLGVFELFALSPRVYARVAPVHNVICFSEQTDPVDIAA
jgi:hypothetical protein